MLRTEGLKTIFIDWRVWNNQYAPKTLDQSKLDDTTVMQGHYTVALVIFHHSSLLLPRFCFSHSPQPLLTFMTFGQDMDDISCDSPSLVDTSKRVDFISELPLEIVVECIVPRIMEYHGRAFNLIGRQNYFAVCTTWSKRIAENNDSIHFNLESDRLSSKLDFMRVKAVAPYIKTLIVVTRSVASIFKLFHYGQLSSLHNLTIKGKDVDDDVHTNLVHQHWYPHFI